MKVKGSRTCVRPALLEEGSRTYRVQREDEESSREHELQNSEGRELRGRGQWGGGGGPFQ